MESRPPLYRRNGELSPASPAPPGSDGPESDAGSEGSSASGGSAGGSPSRRAWRPSPRAPPPLAASQERVAAALARVITPGAPGFVSFPSLVCFLSGPPDPPSPAGSPFAAAAAALFAAGEGAVYLADGRAFTPEALRLEFPELGFFFRGDLRAAFSESPAAPGLWLENQDFARLRAFAPMRRELANRRTSLSPEDLKLLLGLVSAPGGLLEPRAVS
jgi:hypothetical protein